MKRGGNYTCSSHPQQRVKGGTDFEYIDHFLLDKPWDHRDRVCQGAVGCLTRRATLSLQAGFGVGEDDCGMSGVYGEKSLTLVETTNKNAEQCLQMFSDC